MQKYIKHGRPNPESKLKAMTQPKFQDLMLNCELPVTDKNSSKASKVKRVVSTKSGKEFKNLTFNSSIGSVGGLNAFAHSKMLQSQYT